MMMRRMGLLASAALAGALIGSSAASATTVIDLISGSFNEGIGSFSGEITLDVVGGQAISGSGYINYLGLTDVPLVLITTSTPGNEGPGVGFRANDGTDFFGADTNWPPDWRDYCSTLARQQRKRSNTHYMLSLLERATAHSPAWSTEKSIMMCPGRRL